MRKLLSLLLLVTLTLPALAAPARVTGKVVEAGSKNPVAGAVVRLDQNYLWAITGEDGSFALRGVQHGTYQLEVSCLGYVTCQKKLDVRGNIEGLTVELALNSLALEEVVVTAETSADNLNTTQTIGRTALDHLQKSGPDHQPGTVPPFRHQHRGQRRLQHGHRDRRCEDGRQCQLRRPLRNRHPQPFRGKH